MPCGGGDIEKPWLTIIFMLMSRLTLSMKTSLKNYEYNTYDLQNMGGIQFIKTSNGRAHCIPEGQQETDG